MKKDVVQSLKTMMNRLFESRSRLSMRMFFNALLGISIIATVSGADLNVMSFNVRYPSSSDGDNKWEARRDVLIDCIREQKPDVMGTQELFELQGNYIVEKLPQYAWFGISRRGNQTDEYMGVFYLKEKFTVVESGNFWLSETPEIPGSMSWGVSLPRMVTWGLFEDKHSKKRFYLANTHFAHRREDNEARKESARVLDQWLAKLPSAIPVVLTGDFNTAVNSEPYQILTKSMKDSRAGLKDPAGEIGTVNIGFTGKPSANRIDWILYRGKLKPTRFETVLFHQNGRYPSDHFPVTARFRQ